MSNHANYLPWCLVAIIGYSIYQGDHQEKTIDGAAIIPVELVREWGDGYSERYRTTIAVKSNPCTVYEEVGYKNNSGDYRNAFSVLYMECEAGSINGYYPRLGLELKGNVIKGLVYKSIKEGYTATYTPITWYNSLYLDLVRWAHRIKASVKASVKNS